MLQSIAAGLGALRPGREFGHDAVLPARDEACLLLPGLRLEVLTDNVLGWHPVGLLDTGDVSRLDALLPPEALQGLLVAAGEDGPALVPAADLPVVQLLVPVADPKAALLVVRPLGLLAVRGQRGPALHVGAPHCSRLDATWTALISHASPPRAWKTREDADIAHLFVLPPWCKNKLAEPLLYFLQLLQFHSWRNSSLENTEQVQDYSSNPTFVTSQAIHSLVYPN